MLLACLFTMGNLEHGTACASTTVLGLIVNYPRPALSNRAAEQTGMLKVIGVAHTDCH